MANAGCLSPRYAVEEDKKISTFVIYEDQTEEIKPLKKIGIHFGCGLSGEIKQRSGYLKFSTPTIETGFVPIELYSAFILPQDQWKLGVRVSKTFSLAVDSELKTSFKSALNTDTMHISSEAIFGWQSQFNKKDSIALEWKVVQTKPINEMADMDHKFKALWTHTFDRGRLVGELWTKPTTRNINWGVKFTLSITFN
ncbi:hypothetical protein KC845_02675 [Candidatus Kaiserbacteria bacterium]|nr:hypothetical protein [Candidatus Kaiserbacteria bacterium]